MVAATHRVRVARLGKEMVGRPMTGGKRGGKMGTIRTPTTDRAAKVHVAVHTM
jgi:hypothetical protein